VGWGLYSEVYGTCKHSLSYSFHFFLQLREKRLEQEKDLLIKQKDWFESQLKEKSEAYFTQKKEHVSTTP
jgi:hypothetical protein